MAYLALRSAAVHDVGMILAPMLAAGIVAAGALIHRPARWLSWGLLAVGCMLQSASMVVFVAQSQGGQPDVRGLSGAMAVLAYPAMFVGVAGITARTRNSWSTEPPTAITVTAIGTGLVWLIFTLPYVEHHHLPLTEAQWVGVLALADAVLAATALRRVVHTDRRNWTFWLLGTGFVVWGNGHGEIGTRLFDHRYDSGSTITWLAIAGPLLIGLAALLPSMADVPTPVRDADSTRTTALWLAVPPAAIVVARTADTSPVMLWVVVPSAALLAVVVARVASLVERLDDPPAYDNHP